MSLADERSDVRRLRATAHPIRLEMLSLLTGAELSAAEVARELGITHANASYHLRTLLDAGELVIASEEKIRGGVAKRYRHPWEKGAARPRKKYLPALAALRTLGKKQAQALLDGIKSKPAA